MGLMILNIRYLIFVAIRQNYKKQIREKIEQKSNTNNNLLILVKTQSTTRKCKKKTIEKAKK